MLGRETAKKGIPGRFRVKNRYGLKTGKKQHATSAPIGPINKSYDNLFQDIAGIQLMLSILVDFQPSFFFLLFLGQSEALYIVPLYLSLIHI